jgi:hypothetical protein
MGKKKVSKSGDAVDDPPRVPEVQDILGFTNDVEEASDTGGGETGKEFTKLIHHTLSIILFGCVDFRKTLSW